MTSDKKIYHLRMDKSTNYIEIEDIHANIDSFKQELFPIHLANNDYHIN